MATVLAITSQVVSGDVGASAFAAPLTALGHRVDVLPTVVLAHHAGLPGGARGLSVSSDALAEIESGLDDLGYWQAVDTVYTGYFRNAEQAEWAAALVARIRTTHPGVRIACDPVLGDVGKGFYVPEEVAEAVAALLVPQADLLFPNRFELGYLTGTPIESPADATLAAAHLGPEEIVATSFAAAPERIGAMVRDGDAWVLAHTPRLDTPAPGAGDLFGGCYLAHRLSGASRRTALTQATATAFAILRASIAEGSSEGRIGAGSPALTEPDTENVRIETV